MAYNGFNQRCKELKDNGYLTVYDMSVLLKRGQETVRKAINSLNIKPFEIVNTFIFYTNEDKNVIEDYLNKLFPMREEYDKYESLGYRTLMEIFNENGFTKSLKKSINNYIEFLDKSEIMEVYHPKAHKNAELYSPKLIEKIVEFGKLSKGDKSKIICKLTYGVESTLQLEEKRKLMSEINKANSAERTIKRNKTNMERYGTCNFVNSDKTKKTIIEKYGSVENYNLEMGKRRKERFATASEKFCKENDCSMFSEIFEVGVKHKDTTMEWCLKQMDVKLLTFENVFYIKNCDIPLINEQLDKIGKNYSHSSKDEQEIIKFIKSKYDGEIIENDRKVIFPKELDIYIPNKKVAIEFDGLYWHSTEHQKNKNYHLNKTIACEEKGIRLIHIFEDEWKCKQDIVKSIILSSLGIYERKIFARKCEVKEVDDFTFRNFCNENHIQGECNSSERLGLFYNNELVQCVGFGKSRFTKNENELIRMVTKLNTQVIGGFSKLMKHYGKNCISYIDRRLFDGKGYNSSGFEYILTNKPNYYYTKKFERFYRMNFTKQNIAKKFPNKYDSNLTEEENMKKLGFYRIYDCGTIKVKWTAK